jgi:hypothetical protein
MGIYYALNLLAGKYINVRYAQYPIAISGLYRLQEAQNRTGRIPGSISQFGLLKIAHWGQYPDAHTIKGPQLLCNNRHTLGVNIPKRQQSHFTAILMNNLLNRTTGITGQEGKKEQ